MLEGEISRVSRLIRKGSDLFHHRIRAAYAEVLFISTARKAQSRNDQLLCRAMIAFDIFSAALWSIYGLWLSIRRGRAF